MRVLGIETSCDDTSVAIYDNKHGLIYDKTLNQDIVHSCFGGVVPELAARSHINQLIFLIQKSIKKLQYHVRYNKNKKIVDLIAYTAGPGLIGSLLVGATMGCTLSCSWNIPCIGVNHLEGHIFSVMLQKNKPTFPFLSLLVSGGNTQLIYVFEIGKYKILGETLDDAVGNVFDKVAQQLNLKYPGGPKLSQLAKFGKKSNYYFPRPMIKSLNFNFSFSGLRTYTENIIKTSQKTFQNQANIAKAFEDAAIETLVLKCKYALKKTGLNTLVVCGGVSSNLVLRYQLKKLMSSLYGNIFFAKKKFCTDNAAMIAYTGYLKSKKYHSFVSNSIFVNPKWTISQI
ncbi:tRNA (adenosine(37)-N6)-threonylcarbamoyltransferase complex transferase subunit TsaD [Buchnera aphidicola]|uniref:tRNA N6-adenosine threonylcarbamoyltransferase n=1 Tax=Buchnera aphidicola subsp. Tuberolachnus salignus TaxID=98804 RepID=A0A160SWB0_BUCTT|nr:tRNA (adenosine(37)-N6)-threonylcarbamoyltransferase complex transferase subunit TsaD [Buchnera aphidicola]CUR53022.1 tRNA N6-adenosine threonylcarbamoyltransferase [Buchnera aphidicola (Tuberolachnus salignus)]